MATQIGQQLPADFLVASQRRRLLDGAATAINEGGYSGTSVRDLVRAARVARNTFYENFSKEGIARALVADVSSPAALRLDPVDLERCGISILAVEASAAWIAGSLAKAEQIVREAHGAIRALPESASSLEASREDLCALPAGRHGLPREFVTRNQRRRMLTALAEAIAELGYRPSTIKDVTTRARVSRRTFYEHFGSIRSAAFALAVETSQAGVDVLQSADADSGLEALAIEVVATAVSSGVDASQGLADEAVQTLDLLSHSFAGVPVTGAAA